MFTKKRPSQRSSSGKPVGRRGRPPGRTPQGEATRQALYGAAIKLFAERGYAETTLREIADRAGVSVGLLYRYFPSKLAVVLALYDELSRGFAETTRSLPAGTWGTRFLTALRCSLRVLEPHRDALSALVPVLVGGREEGLFAPATAFSRERVQRAFIDAVVGADDPPGGDDAEVLGRTLYLVHLAIVLWWLLDRSANQRATLKLIELTERLLPFGGLALRFPPTLVFVRGLDSLVAEALFDAPEFIHPN